MNNFRWSGLFCIWFPYFSEHDRLVQSCDSPNSALRGVCERMSLKIEETTWFWFYFNFIFIFDVSEPLNAFWFVLTIMKISAFRKCKCTLCPSIFNFTRKEVIVGSFNLILYVGYLKQQF